ncbi:ArnT family glycosyltransferase [Candidatus Magnetomonas plexicatena]|uniref:ArnT family glycosyltransferase n=1 Tax=Candidatus Magnetomonas plexicatena TaxID=2552947 RepID=UPI00110232AF|nr:hypothetical protein E2O03_012820 [Nitrospirales bacterium LBB_01]
MTDNLKKIALLVMFFIFSIVLYKYTLKEPYHFDSVLYMKTVDVFKDTSRFECFFGARCLSSYILIPLSVFIGAKTLPVTTAITALLALLFYFFWIRRIFGFNEGFLAALLFFFIPASIITVTHVKEDFTAFMFLFAAFLMASKDRPSFLRPLSGLCFGLALVSKDMPIIFVPFYFSYLYVMGAEFEQSYKKLLSKENIKTGIKNILTALSLSLIVSFAIDSRHYIDLFHKTASPYDGQFMGVFSYMLPIGLTSWKHGVGSLLFYLQFVMLMAPFFAKTKKEKLIYILFCIQFAALSIFIANLTVVKYRHYVWTSFLCLPPMLYTVRNFLTSFKFNKKIDSGVLYVVFGTTAAALFGSTYPALDLHSRYNTVASIYKNLNIDKNNSVVSGVDDCVFARYFKGLTCVVHPIDPSESEALAFAKEIESYLNEGKNVYFLPDFFSYDRYGNIEKQFVSRYKFLAGKNVLYSDFHYMDYGFTLKQYERKLAHTYSVRTNSRCEAPYNKTTDETFQDERGRPLPFEIYTYNIMCTQVSTAVKAYVYKHMVITDLSVGTIVKVERP